LIIPGPGQWVTCDSKLKTLLAGHRYKVAKAMVGEQNI
jgi:hypothetical protein